MAASPPRRVPLRPDVAAAIDAVRLPYHPPAAAEHAAGLLREVESVEARSDARLAALSNGAHAA
eukprot:gene15781-26799_t